MRWRSFHEDEDRGAFLCQRWHSCLEAQVLSQCQSGAQSANFEQLSSLEISIHNRFRVVFFDWINMMNRMLFGRGILSILFILSLN